MADEIYRKLQEVLDTIPNGFPATDDGLEIRILKKIYTEEEADITTKMLMKYETPEAVAERTGMDAAYLKTKLKEMADKGQIFGAKVAPEVWVYKLLPFVFGVYEYQLYRIDKELAEMFEQYMSTAFGEDFHSHGPSMMKVIPIEKEIPNPSVVEPYESATSLINNAKAWAVSDCICKKEKHLLGNGCDNPLEVCLGLAPMENFFEDFFWGKPISKDEALKVLEKAEDAGLVHMTANTREGHIYICNCCGCCCGMLRGINEMGNNAAVAHSNYIAVVDESLCTSCGICEDRCQVKGIEVRNAAEVNDRCIGCGLCVSTCPTAAITMERRDEKDILHVPVDEREWLQHRAEASGRKDYKKLL